jgi:2-aminoadipate transaminase
MDRHFSNRISNVPKSFIREILKVGSDPAVISFAGGLPNKDYFPVKELQAAANLVFQKSGKEALQYTCSEGLLGLRHLISDHYKTKKQVSIDPENILMTTGSQQALDLIGKTFINEGDEILIEEPGYLGAIQAFSLYQPNINTVPLLEDGVDIVEFKKIIAEKKPKFFYTVPNFQNPSGLTYSEEKRKAVAEIIVANDMILVEDDPYGDLRFEGTHKSLFKKLIPDNTIYLGSFSKIISPGLRVGWVAAAAKLMDRILVAKQASDLHSTFLSQMMIYEYLIANDLDAHINKVCKVYNEQRLAMLAAIEEHFPKSVSVTKVEGGLFLWLTLPEGVAAKKLFELAISQKVAFVPGDPFYVGKTNVNTFRLNFSCATKETIDIGIKRLGHVIGSNI